MDHQHAINRLRSAELLSAAFDYAVFDRTHGDYFFDPFEIEHAQANRDEVIAEIIEELADPETFTPRSAIAYFPPKNDLCERRMVYIPIKDLTIRYAIAILFSEELEDEIHPQCFANRRAVGDDELVRFTEDFATGGWGRFCAWQSEQSEQHSVLLKTDISAFYDSISHDYLLGAVSRHLDLSRECALMILFRKLLRVPVIYYSPASGQIEPPALVEQGLPIGDGVEGYLANIFLKDVDDAMTRANAPYGRYVDDIRLFGNTREEVIANLRILQEQLLRKGLNLNASKTAIAEDDAGLANLVSRIYSDGDYSGGDGEDEDLDAGTVIGNEIDQPFSNFSRVFTAEEGVRSASDAKDFCKFLSAHDAAGDPIVDIGERALWHIQCLRDVIVRWRGAGKHAAWLLVQTAVYRGVPVAAKRRARTVLFQILSDSSISSYTRYRILHHLVKLRQNRRGGTFRFIEQLTVTQRERTRELMPSFISAPAFELNLIGLYTLRVLGTDLPRLRQIVRENGNQRCQPLRNALSAMAQTPETIQQPMAADDEPDATPDPY